MKNKLLAVFILLMLLASVFGITVKIPVKAQPETPIFRVEPSEYRATCPSEIFDIDITVNDLDASWKAVSVQFRLGYDDTLLEVVDVVEGPFLKNWRWNLYGTYFINYVEPYDPYGPHVLVGILLLPNAEGEYDQTKFPEGSGTIATITFQVKDVLCAECPLHLIDDKETYLLDFGFNEIPVEMEDGKYYSPCPSLTVEPRQYDATYVGEIFDINITLNNLCASWRVVIAQFRLGYDDTLLEVVDVVEGSFLQDSRWNLYGTYFINYVDSDGLGPHVLVGILLLPNAEGEYDQTQFPEGSGTIATITFKAISSPGKCALHFIDDEETFILNDDLDPIPHKLEDGQFYLSPWLRVEPSEYKATSVGEIFDINITLNNLNASWRVVIAQFRLGFDNEILEFVSCTEGDFLDGFAPYGTFFWSEYEPDGFHGPHVLGGFMIYPNATGGWEPPFPEGSGTIATITFKAIKVPACGVVCLPAACCALHFIDDEETFILNDDLDPIPHKKIDGEYCGHEVFPYATLAVEPSEYLANTLNETFSINVTMNNLYAGWRMVAVEFRLGYNDTLLEVVDVVEGSFLQDSRWNLYGTYFIPRVETDGRYGPHVLVGILLLPNATGEYDQTQFPEGSGTIATITFKAIYQSRGVEIAPPCCEIKLLETMIINYDLIELPHNVDPSECLYCMTPAFTFDLNVDGKVDMKDISLVAKAFGSYPGHERWNPICDMTGPQGVPDGIVDMRDVAMVARMFGYGAA